MTLDEFMTKHRWRNRDVARLVGLSDAILSLYRRSLRRPSLETAIKIRDWTVSQATGDIVDIDDWPSPVTKRRAAA